MKKISTFFATAALAIAAIFTPGCQNPQYQASDNPQMFTGWLKHNESFFSPLRDDKPKYAFYDINNRFVSYVCFDNMLVSSVEPYVNCHVVVRGNFCETDQGLMLRVDMIRYNR